MTLYLSFDKRQKQAKKKPLVTLYLSFRQKQIAFPEGLESIGYEAFEHCEELTDIYIPSTVTYLGDYAFDDCPKLTLWLHKKAYRHIWGYFREFPDINFKLVEEEPCFFKTSGE